jgi:DNA topoisomerase-3
MRVLFTARDPRTIREAFGRAKPNSEYSRVYAAAVARRQADQICTLSLTGAATVSLPRRSIWAYSCSSRPVVSAFPE